MKLTNLQGAKRLSPNGALQSKVISAFFAVYEIFVNIVKVETISFVTDFFIVYFHIAIVNTAVLLFRSYCNLFSSIVAEKLSGTFRKSLDQSLGKLIIVIAY